MSALTTYANFQAALALAQRRGRQRLADLKPLVDSKRIYLFGYGGKGRTLARHIRQTSTVKVIVYDSQPQTRTLAARDGFATVETLSEIDQSRYGTVLGACQAQLEQASIIHGNRIYFQEAAYLFDAPHLSHKTREFSDWIIGNEESLYRVYESIHPQSRAAFVCILSFRLSLDPHDLVPCKTRSSDMWFDVPERLGKRRYRTFLDVGAYDGDTLRHASSRLSVSRGIAVEANSSLFPSIKQVAGLYANGILMIPKAAWSHECRLRFSEVRGGMISVCEADDGELEAAPIDDAVREPVDLIKMDIEGAELPALQGCLKTLKTGPDVAIAAYHRPDDFLQLPDFLATAGYANPAFDFHVAHYSDCLDDTIFYFLKSQ